MRAATAAAIGTRRTAAALTLADLLCLTFFLLPVYVMLATSLKPLQELRQGHLLAPPLHWTLAPWRQAAVSLGDGFWNSVRIVVPSTVLTVLCGALNGYALACWRSRAARALFVLLMSGAFVPLQVMIFPLVRALAYAGLMSSLPGIVLAHVIFGMPVMTLLFRNYFASLPVELMQAAAMDGAGFLRTLLFILMPAALPMFAVAIILQGTGVWNDYLLGLVFAGAANLPMTVQLNNFVNTTSGTREYDIDMAATLLTSLAPLLLYVLAGRMFVRGITAGIGR